MIAKLALDGRSPAGRRHRDTAVAAEQVRVRARSVDVARVPLVRAWVVPRASPRPRAQVEAAEIVPAEEGATGCGEGATGCGEGVAGCGEGVAGCGQGIAGCRAVFS